MPAAAAAAASSSPGDAAPSPSSVMSLTLNATQETLEEASESGGLDLLFGKRYLLVEELKFEPRRYVCKDGTVRLPVKEDFCGKR